MGFGLVIKFTGLLELITTEDSAITNSHTLQFTMAAVLHQLLPGN
jgi:hypothetical protein